MNDLEGVMDEIAASVLEDARRKLKEYDLQIEVLQDRRAQWAKAVDELQAELARRARGCSHCGDTGWYEDVYSADDPDTSSGWHEEGIDDWVDGQRDYAPDPINEWRFPELRPDLYAIFRWWGVRYLPVWIYGVARGFWLDSVVPHFGRSEEIEREQAE